MDKRGKFLWWEWPGEDNITTVDNKTLLFNSKKVKNTQDYIGLDDKYKLETTSGFIDFTPNGEMLELTEDQRACALTRKVKL